MAGLIDIHTNLPPTRERERKKKKKPTSYEKKTKNKKKKQKQNKGKNTTLKPFYYFACVWRVASPKLEF